MKPNEKNKLDLDVRVHAKAGHMHESTEAEFIKNMNLLLGTDLMCVGTDEYNKVSMQNLKRAQA
jgi:hypothetical protein